MACSMTPELRLMVAPARTYARLARQPSPVGPLTALRRPLLAALALGLSMSIAATRHVTAPLAFDTTLAWMPVVAVQVGIALLLIARPARRTVGVARGLDLFFVGHAPWSLFLLALAALPAPLGRPLVPPLWLALVPLAMTVRAIAAFFREVLQFGSRRAAAWTMVHQAITWSTFAALYGSAVALQPRIVERLEAWFGW
jgi:hypothetical protein